MSDLYTELLVKKEKTVKDSLIRIGLMTLVVLLAFVGLFIYPLFLLGAVAAGVAAYFIIPRTELEFEYLFVNGEMDIDKIMAKSKRKRVLSFNLAEADIAAPVKSHRMDYYNGNQKMKVLDFSSGNPEHNRMAVITRVNNEACRIILEPDEALVKSMKNSAPSKVFLD